MRPRNVIAGGITIGFSALVALSWALNAWGQIKGDFQYIPHPLMMLVFLAVIFVGAFGLSLSTLVGYRVLTFNIFGHKFTLSEESDGDKPEEIVFTPDKEAERRD